MLRRVVRCLAVLLLFGGAAILAWDLLDLPPIGFVLSYGYPSPMGPTGRTVEVEGIEFVEIAPGYFRMGVPTENHFLIRVSRWLGLSGAPRRKAPADWSPAHWVEFRHGFWIARTEVVNRSHERFASDRARHPLSPGDEHPAAGVAWCEAVDFCGWLADRSGLPVRLPSEAEWEGACRAGSHALFCYGDDPARLGEYAWCDLEAEGRLHRAGGKRPNAWGFFDLHGNAAEWVLDPGHEGYEGAPTDGSVWSENPSGRPGAPFRLLRGGSHRWFGDLCSSPARWYTDEVDDGTTGFRPAFAGVATD